MLFKEPLFCRKPVYRISPRQDSYTKDFKKPLIIALTGDWHVSHIVTEKQRRFLKNRLTQIKPDVIILQGDLFDTPLSLGSSALCLELKKSMKLCSKIAPTVMVLGNHDQVEPDHTSPTSLSDYNNRVYKNAIPEWRRLCKESGVKLLVNSWFEVKNLRIFGFLQDPYCYYCKPNEKGENYAVMKKAIKNLSSEGVLKPKEGFVHWFAAHAPLKDLYEMPELKFFDTFSFGHTHGGCIFAGLDVLADKLHFHGGLVAPFQRWFPSREMRGKETLKNGASLVVNTGMVMSQASAPAILQIINFLKNADVTEVILQRNR